MKLIKPEVIIEGDIDGDRILKHIEKIGRTCYKSEDKITSDSAKKFVQNIMNRGHLSVIEHFNISVRFIIDRGVSHELVRHRLCAFSQESTRYVDYNKKGIEFIIPPWITSIYDKTNFNNIPYNIWYESMLHAEASYNNLIKTGWTPQEARSVLPNSLKTEIVTTANLREWRHILKLRTSNAAHPQMREVMIVLLEKFKSEIPIIFDDINIDKQKQVLR
jgi:thymidylate synthase (FAD)